MGNSCCGESHTVNRSYPSRPERSYPSRPEEPKTTPRVNERALARIDNGYTGSLDYVSPSPDGLVLGTVKVNTGKIEIGGRTVNYACLDSQHAVARVVEDEDGAGIAIQTYNRRQIIIDSDSD